MNIQRVKQTIVLLAVVWGAALTLMQPADAAVYRGRWDPAYGPAYPDLGWRGEADFFIPDACKDQADGWYSNAGGMCGGMEILTGKVEFYQVSDALKPTLDTLLFDQTNFDITLQMRVESNGVVGVRGAFLLPEETSLTLAGGPDSYFWLGFWGDSTRLANCEFNFFDCSLNSNAIGSRATMSFAQVPEPASHLLAFTALALLAVMGRTRRRR